MKNPNCARCGAPATSVWNLKKKCGPLVAVCRKCLVHFTTKRVSEEQSVCWRAQQTAKYKQRAARKTTEMLNLYADKMGLPENVVEQAMQINKLALNAGLGRGRSHKVIMAASTYAACRLSRTPSSLTTFYKLYPGHLFFSIARTYNLLVRRLALKVPTQDTSANIHDIAAKLALDQQITQEAVRLLDIASKKGITAGKKPAGMAAALLLMVCLDNSIKILEKDIAEAAGVSEVTVRNRLKELRERLAVPKESDSSTLQKRGQDVTEENEQARHSSLAVIREQFRRLSGSD